MNLELLLISEAARALGVGAETLRRWEREGKIQAQRTSGGVRLFSAADIEALRKEREA